MKDTTKIAGNDTRYWELVDDEHLDLNSGRWGPLYRYPIYTGVPVGETVIDGFSQRHQAPLAAGTYVLYQYVQDGSISGPGWKWEKEEK